jgi:hypothetical protein
MKNKNTYLLFFAKLGQIFVIQNFLLLKKLKDFIIIN